MTAIDMHVALFTHYGKQMSNWHEVKEFGVKDPSEVFIPFSGDRDESVSHLGHWSDGKFIGFTDLEKVESAGVPSVLHLKFNSSPVLTR